MTMSGYEFCDTLHTVNKKRKKSPGNKHSMISDFF